MVFNGFYLNLSGESSLNLSGESFLNLSGESSLNLSGDSFLNLSGESALNLSGDSRPDISDAEINPALLFRQIIIINNAVSLNFISVIPVYPMV